MKKTVLFSPVIFIFFMATVILHATGTCQSRGNTLQARDNGYLVPNQTLESPNRLYYLIYQSDGNLIIYKKGIKQVNPTVIWSSKTAGKGAWRATMQSDGNFVIKSDPRKILFQTYTSGSGNVLMLDNDGQLYITNGKVIVWSSRMNIFLPKKMGV